MAEDYAAIAAEVVDIIVQLGASITITRTVSGPLTPSSTTALVTTPLTVTAVDCPAKSMRMPGTGELNTSRLALIAAGGSIPLMGDLLTIGGTVHQVGQVHTIAPGGVDLLYMAEIAT